jgi:hypothetical protein
MKVRRIKQVIWKRVLVASTVGAWLGTSASCKHGTGAEEASVVHGSSASAEEQAPMTKHPLTEHAHRVEQWFNHNSAYAAIIPFAAFNEVNDTMRALGIEYLRLHNNMVRAETNPGRQTAMAQDLYDERVDACMLNPAGKENTTVKRWFYCQFPMELRLCNTVVLVFSKKYEPAADRLKTRLSHFDTCLRNIPFPPFGYYDEAFEIAFANIAISKSYAANAGSSSANNGRLLSGSAAVKHLYEKIYLNDDLTLGAGENAEIQEGDKAENMSRWRGIIMHGRTVGVEPPMGEDPKSLVDHAIHWLRKFMFLKNPNIKDPADPSHLAKEDPETTKIALEEISKINGIAKKLANESATAEDIDGMLMVFGAAH